MVRKYIDENHPMSCRGFREVKKELMDNPMRKTILPRRSDDRSAGYDFYSKENILLEPGKSHAFYTDVKSFMLEDESLFIYVRSSIGIRRGLMLANTVGVIDSSYYENPDNDGNIIIVLKNISNDIQYVESGDRIAQGVFQKFLTTDDDALTVGQEPRSGGIGSTGN